MTSSNFKIKTFNQPTMGYSECLEAHSTCIPSRLYLPENLDCLESVKKLGISTFNCVTEQVVRFHNSVASILLLGTPISTQSNAQSSKYISDPKNPKYIHRETISDLAMNPEDCAHYASLDRNINCVLTKIKFDDAQQCINNCASLMLSTLNCIIDGKTNNIYLILARPMIQSLTSVHMSAVKYSETFYEALKKPFKTNSSLDSSAPHKPKPQTSLVSTNTSAKNTYTISNKTSETALQTRPNQTPLALTKPMEKQLTVISSKKALALSPHSNPLAVTDSKEKLSLALEESGSSYIFNAKPLSTIYLQLNRVIQHIPFPTIGVAASLPLRENLGKALQIASSKFSDTGICLARNISLDASALPVSRNATSLNQTTISTESFEKPSENNRLAAGNVAMVFAASFISFCLLKTALKAVRNQYQKLQNNNFSVLG